METTELKGGHLYYMRNRLIEGWSIDGRITSGEVSETNEAVRSLIRHKPTNARLLASVHPTLLGELFNTVLEAVLVLSIPQRLCPQHGEEPPHHDHDGRISCKVASLAESYRTPFI